jgi:hypothetical protein
MGYHLVPSHKPSFEINSWHYLITLILVSILILLTPVSVFTPEVRASDNTTNTNNSTRTVTDPAKVVTDPVLIDELNRQGIPIDEVELYHDYGVGAGESPYAQVYRHLNSDKEFAVISGLPRCDENGIMLRPEWVKLDDGWHEKWNTFNITVHDDGSFSLTSKNSYPDGRKPGSTCTVNPTVLLDGVSQNATGLTVLAIDPLNPNYENNTLLINYVPIIRLIRIIEGSFQGYWLAPKTLAKDIQVKYNQTGDFKLNLGKYAISDDEEFFPANLFDLPVDPRFIDSIEYQGATYLLFSDSMSFYSDADAVDGNTGYDGPPNNTWAYLRTHANYASYNAYLGNIIYQDCAAANSWDRFYHAFFLFDTSELPDTANISTATLSFYATYKKDVKPFNWKAAIFSSSPASNTQLVTADHPNVGATLFSNEIAYASLHGDTRYPPVSGMGYDQFTLNASGIAAISTTNVSKFSLLESVYDAPNNDPSGTAGAGQYMYYYGYFSEQGTGYKPTLVVTYTQLLPPTNVQASDGDPLHPLYVTINWTSSSGATGYKVYRNTDNNSNNSTLLGSVTAAPYSDNSATPLTPYYYWAKSYNGSGDSDNFSNSDIGWSASHLNWGTYIYSSANITTGSVKQNFFTDWGAPNDNCTIYAPTWLNSNNCSLEVTSAYNRYPSSTNETFIGVWDHNLGDFKFQLTSSNWTPYIDNGFYSVNVTRVGNTWCSYILNTQNGTWFNMYNSSSSGPFAYGWAIFEEYNLQESPWPVLGKTFESKELKVNTDNVTERQQGEQFWNDLSQQYSANYAANERVWHWTFTD